MIKEKIDIEGGGGGVSGLGFSTLSYGKERLPASKFRGTFWNNRIIIRNRTGEGEDHWQTHVRVHFFPRGYSRTVFPRSASRARMFRRKVNQPDGSQPNADKGTNHDTGLKKVVNTQQCVPSSATWVLRNLLNANMTVTT